MFFRLFVAKKSLTEDMTRRILTSVACGPSTGYRFVIVGVGDLDDYVYLGKCVRFNDGRPQRATPTIAPARSKRVGLLVEKSHAST